MGGKMYELVSCAVSQYQNTNRIGFVYFLYLTFRHREILRKVSNIHLLIKPILYIKVWIAKSIVYLVDLSHLTRLDNDLSCGKLLNKYLFD